MSVGPLRKLSAKELMLSNCGAVEDFRIPWTAIRSNQSILKEISPEYSLEGLMLMLKHQYFGHLMQRADSLEKTLMLEKIEGRRSGEQRMRWLDGISDNGNEFEETPGDGEGQGVLVFCSLWDRKESDMTYCPSNNNNVLAIVNSAAMRFGVAVSFPIMVFSR